MTVLCTHRVAQMDFRRSLRMVRRILTERKRATTRLLLWYLALYLVIYGSQGQRRLTLLWQITLLINPLVVNLRVSVETHYTQRAAPQPVQQVKQVSQEGKATEKQSGCVRLFHMNVRYSAPQPQNNYCLIQSCNNRVLFMVNNISAQRLHLEGSTHSATLLKRLLSKTLKSAAGRVCFHPRPFVGP